MIPDIERLVGDYLREHPEVAALDARVGPRTPERDMAHPWVRVTQLDAANAPESRPDYLIRYLVQLDCFAGDTAMRSFTGQGEASLLARTVRQALHEMPDVDHDEGFVTSVRFTNMARIPDTDFKPARERYVLDAVVVAHELVGAGS